MSTCGDTERTTVWCRFVLAACFAVFAGVSMAAPHPVVAAFTNEHAILEFDSRGRIARLCDRRGGASLVKAEQSTVQVICTNGVARPVCALKAEGGHLRFSLSKCTGDIVISVRSERWGFVFSVEECTLKAPVPISSYLLLRVTPTEPFKDGYGRVLNAASDETHTIVLRGYETECASRTAVPNLDVLMDGAFSPVGKRFALVLAKWEHVIDCLKCLTLDSGVFHTECGGAWSLGAPENRRSYLFAHFSHDTIDDYIDLAERGGFRTLHASGWWKALGHYEPSPVRFPGGEDDFKACIERARSAGLAVGTHTLTSGIAFQDPWITPVCNTNVLSLYRYTLAEPLAEDATELTVVEKPGPRHHVVTTYFSNGNILRIGTELMTYTGMTRKPPYRFTGLKRGAYGTRRTGLVARGSAVDYVFQHFMTLFPDPKTPFGVEMAQHLGAFCNRMGFSFVYQDGAEPFKPYDLARNRLNFAQCLDQSKGPVQIEASVWNNESWPFHSRIGASDHPVWAVKRFHDNHLRDVRQAVRNNFISGQMGWWNPRLACDYADGHYLDDMEYFAAKNAAWDLPMSVQGVRPKAGPLPLSQARMMTLLGWYERARLAHAFTPEALQILRSERGETLLRQNADGRWMLSEMMISSHRVRSSEYRTWQVVSEGDSAAALRVKALLGAESYTSTNAVSLVGADDIVRMERETAKDVMLTFEAADSVEHGKVLRFVAENKGTTRTNAWAQSALVYTHPYRDVRVRSGKSNAAFGFWVKGDGSGAFLDLQVKSPSVFVGGVSDHILKIDFVGWRYVRFLLRERDTEEFYNHNWPFHPKKYAHFRQAVNLERLESVRLCLTEIPAGGCTEIELSQVKVLPARERTLRGMRVVVRGERHEVPFALSSGDFAELENGVWTHYSQRGEALAQASAKSSVVLASGTNDVVFADDDCEGDARAEVQFFVHGRRVSALLSKPVESEPLAYEAVMPMPFDPARGFCSLPPVRTRPRESARLEFTVYGAVTDPSVTIGSETIVFPVVVPCDAKLVVRDGESWQVEDYAHKILKQGRLRRPLPILKSGETAVFSAKAGTNACFSVVKRYGASMPRKFSRSPKLKPSDISAKMPSWQGCAVRLSSDVMWAIGGFGEAMAFDGGKSVAEVTPTIVATNGWTVTAWVRADPENRARSPWTLSGERLSGASLVAERWAFVALCGTGAVPSFRVGTDGTTGFKGLVDDLVVHAQRLDVAQVGERSSDAEHVDVLGYQDDGTGGVAPIRIVPQGK